MVPLFLLVVNGVQLNRKSVILFNKQGIKWTGRMCLSITEQNNTDKMQKLLFVPDNYHINFFLALQLTKFIYIYRLSSNIEQILTEEEISYVDQLKEYLYFTESLRLGLLIIHSVLVTNSFH